MHNIFVLHYVYFMPLHVSSTCAHHQEVKIALRSLWYHHIYQHMQRPDVLLQLGYIWRHVSAVKRPKHVARYCLC